MVDQRSACEAIKCINDLCNRCLHYRRFHSFLNPFLTVKTSDIVYLHLSEVLNTKVQISQQNCIVHTTEVFQILSTYYVKHGQWWYTTCCTVKQGIGHEDIIYIYIYITMTEG